MGRGVRGLSSRGRKVNLFAPRGGRGRGRGASNTANLLALPPNDDDDEDDDDDEARDELEHEVDDGRNHAWQEYHNYLQSKRGRVAEQRAENRDVLEVGREQADRVATRLPGYETRFPVTPNPPLVSDLGDPMWRHYEPGELKRPDDYRDELEMLFSEAYFEARNDPVLRTLFEGVVIYVNGYTNPSASYLLELMKVTGGGYTLAYEPGQTTHIIAEQISKAHQRSELHRSITVQPAWIMESLRARKVLQCYEFLVYKLKNPDRPLDRWFVRKEPPTTTTTITTTTITEQGGTLPPSTRDYSKVVFNAKTKLPLKSVQLSDVGACFEENKHKMVQNGPKIEEVTSMSHNEIRRLEVIEPNVPKLLFQSPEMDYFVKSMETFDADCDRVKSSSEVILLDSDLAKMAKSSEMIMIASDDDNECDPQEIPGKREASKQTSLRLRRERSPEMDIFQLDRDANLQSVAGSSHGGRPEGIVRPDLILAAAKASDDDDDDGDVVYLSTSSSALQKPPPSVSRPPDSRGGGREQCRSSVLGGEEKVEETNPPANASAQPIYNTSDHIPISLTDVPPDVFASLPPDIQAELKAVIGGGGVSYSIVSSATTSKPSSNTVQPITLKRKSEDPSGSREPKKLAKLETLRKATGEHRHRGKVKLPTGQRRIDTMMEDIRKRDELRNTTPLFKKMDFYYNRRKYSKNPPNICGKTKLKSILPLLSEWITTCREVNDSDLTYVLRYLARQIDRQRFRPVRVIMVHLRDLIRKEPNNSPWRGVFHDGFLRFFTDERTLPSGVLDLNEIFNID